MPLTIIQRVELLRSIRRPTVNDYIPIIFQDFTELHGDRHFGDDPAIMSGIGVLGDLPVTIIAQVKGRDIEELKRTNFSMPHPEGYRKALRLARQAEKFSRPVICLIDTPGAFCGVGAEERGQGEAIARNLMEFMTLKTPVISVVLGEGGSGGALALGVCDELAMLENALYSVISPRRIDANPRGVRVDPLERREPGKGKRSCGPIKDHLRRPPLLRGLRKDTPRTRGRGP